MQQAAIFSKKTKKENHYTLPATQQRDKVSDYVVDIVEHLVAKV